MSRQARKPFDACTDRDEADRTHDTGPGSFVVHPSGLMPESTTLSAPNVRVIRFVLSEALSEK